MLVDARFVWPCDFLGTEKRCRLAYELDGMRHTKNVKLKNCSDDIKTLVEEQKVEFERGRGTVYEMVSRDPKWCFWVTSV